MDFPKDPFRKDLSLQAPELPTWPPPIEYLNFEVLPVQKPRPIIDGLLDSSSRLIFGGGSKTYKTWFMSDQALSIAAGAPWLGFPTHQTRTLYVNFELKDYYMQRRLAAIRVAKNINLAPGELLIWNLRGYSVPLELFKDTLIKTILSNAILAVFIDPFYKLLGERDERVSAELNPILGAFEEVNRSTDATVVCAAHYSKGNQAAKDPIERISGGASLNRDPDNIITLTNHETQHAFSVEFTVRDFPPIPPFVVKWNYPLLVRTDLDPAQIKKIGRPTTLNPQDLLSLIAANDDKLSTPQLQAIAESQLGWSRRRVYEKLNSLRSSGLVFLSKLSQHWNVKI